MRHTTTSHHQRSSCNQTPLYADDLKSLQDLRFVLFVFGVAPPFESVQSRVISMTFTPFFFTLSSATLSI